MQTRPDSAALLEAVAAFLLEEVSQTLKGDQRLAFRVLIAANLATVVAHELRGEDDRYGGEARRLKALLPGVADEARLWSARRGERSDALLQLQRELAARLRSGRLSPDDRVLDHLVQTAREAVQASNPRFDLSEEPS